VTEDSGGLHVSFIFLLHPYRIPAITKIRLVHADRELTRGWLLLWEYQFFRGSTQTWKHVELLRVHLAGVQGRLAASSGWMCSSSLDEWIERKKR